MKLIASLDRPIDSTALQLPITVIDDQTVAIQIESFSVEEKKELLGLNRLQRNEHDGWSFSINKTPSLPVMDLHGLLNCECKFVLTKETDNPYELQKVLWDLDFVLRIILGRGLPFTWIRGGSPPFESTGPSHAGSDAFIVSRRKNLLLDKNVCNRIAKLYQELSNAQSKTRVKLDFIYAMLKIANKLLVNEYENGFACATFVAILESIFVPNKGKNITKKFINRIDSTFQENNILRKSLEEFYDKRSTVFHGNASAYPLNKATKEELAQLEDIVCRSIEMYATNPENYTEAKLEKLSQSLTTA